MPSKKKKNSIGAQSPVLLSAGGEQVLGGWVEEEEGHFRRDSGTYLMLWASATAAEKEEVEAESFMDFLAGPRTCPGTQPSAAGDRLLAGR